jgi:hypothetical protein
MLFKVGLAWKFHIDQSAASAALRHHRGARPIRQARKQFLHLD